MHHSHGAAKAVHNMVVVGERRIFLSHLPMFMPPHDTQVILAATFLKKGKHVDDVYFADRAKHKSVRFYTLQPQSFALTDLFPPAGHPALTQFTATVFRGHLEKEGVAIEALTNIDVQVTRVVHAGNLAGLDKLTALTYVMFGDDKERFLAHVISRAPDFDQLLSIAPTGPRPTTEELVKGVTVEVPGRGTKPTDRLKAKEALSVKGQVTGTNQPFDLQVTVKAELYFEEGELADPMTMDTTPEEQKAGFP